MNTHKFVAEKGIEEAKRVLEGAPKIGHYWQEYGVDNKKYYGCDDFFGDWYEYWDIPNALMWQKVYTKEEFSFNRIEIKELKQVVESVELIVNDFESVEIAEYEYMICASQNEPYWVRLKQAIVDHELIYGAKE